MHIGQPTLNAIVVVGQLLVIDPQKMEHRRVEVVPRHWIPVCPIAHLIGRTIGNARFQPCPRHPDTETDLVVITARPDLVRSRLRERGAPKL